MSQQQYTVQSGDTLSKIAQKNGISLSVIEQANPGINPNLIRIGQVINLPATASNPSGSETPESPPSPAANAKYIGYWDWNWYPKPLPHGTNIGLIFSGRTNLSYVFAHAEQVYDRLGSAQKYLCFGGGDTTGSFHQADLTAITEAIKANKLTKYDGIAYDVEVGDRGLAPYFQESFAAAKAAGLKVLVTVSHSSPFGIKDGVTLMHSFFQDENIDFLSPQLYTTGKELKNDYDYAGIKWQEFANAKAAIIPSIVTASYYPDAVEHFKNWGVELQGYVQWW